LGGYDIPTQNEEPLFCLLEDDSLINHAAVETDTLLQPTGVGWEAGTGHDNLFRSATITITKLSRTALPVPREPKIDMSSGRE